MKRFKDYCSNDDQVKYGDLSNEEMLLRPTELDKFKSDFTF